MYFRAVLKFIIALMLTILLATLTSLVFWDVDGSAHLGCSDCVQLYKLVEGEFYLGYNTPETLTRYINCMNSN